MPIGIRPVAAQLKSIAARYSQRVGRTWGDGCAGPRHAGWTVVDLQDPAEKQSVRVGERVPEMARLEAILVLAREPLTTRKLSQYANLADATEARTLIRQLNERYDESGRAFRVEEIAGGFQLLTRPKFASWLRRLEQVPKEIRLSAPALETLAVIAYRQPAGRAEIEAIRGVNCGEILKQLMDRELVRIAGRGDDLGRPYLYATTKRFLQLFGLRNLDELPRAAELKTSSLPTSTGKQPNLPNSASDSPEHIEEEPVTATIRAEQAPEELRKLRAGISTAVTPRARDEEEDIAEDDLDDTDDEEDDFDDEEDLEDEDFDDVDDDDEDLDDEDFDDEEDGDWEEVEDDEEDDEEWEDDDDDEDWEEDEEEEEEGWE